MNTSVLMTAAHDLGYDLTFTIEQDERMWIGKDNERNYLTTAQITALTKRAKELEADKATDKAALLDRLGITADEAALLLG
jgi:DNA-binding SARP family transcriptional activator